MLLVDDEESVRTLGHRMLTKLGFRVLTAADGEDAVALFERHASEVRGVLLDLSMPRMDGEETFQALRRIDPSVRVLMSSGYDERVIIEQMPARGIAGFIQKPYQLGKLREKLRNALKE